MAASNHRLLADWGTSRMRLYLCQDEVVVGRRDGPGLATGQGTPEAKVSALAGDWLAVATSLLICGMAGARSGWREVPYLHCPATLEAVSAGRVTFQYAGLPVSIAPGLRCSNALGAPDVMRGEETQAFGALALRPELGLGSALLVAPGTHSKWIQIDQGRVLQFSTSPTGEMFAALSSSGTLIGPLNGAAPNQTAIERGVQRRLEKAGASLSHLLFEVRARQLVGELSLEEALGLLSGLLIGDDVLGGQPMASRASSIVLIGDPLLTGPYQFAFEQLGFATTCLDGDACALAGLKALEGLSA